MHIYHITDGKNWQKAKGTGILNSETLSTLGFIHCCMADQIDFVLENWFAGESDLFILELDPEKITAELIFEKLESGSDLFPHVYGSIDIDAVVAEKKVK